MPADAVVELRTHKATVALDLSMLDKTVEPSNYTKQKLHLSKSHRTVEWNKFKTTAALDGTKQLQTRHTCSSLMKLWTSA